jgi:erythronate-4-phosphate dehydrogenase
MNILIDSSLPLASKLFQTPLKLLYYNTLQELQEKLAQAQGLICRANTKINHSLLGNSALKFIATASSGIDHIDIEHCKEHNIKIFSAHGSNANAVADYVITTLAVLQKQHYVFKNIAIVGLGAVGNTVALRLKNLKYKIAYYDPFVANTNFTTCKLEELHNFDLISLHTNLHDTNPHPSVKLINGGLLTTLKPNTVIINTARGEVVDEEALIQQKHLVYCTDVYAHEPNINKAVITYAKICTPHIAGHSITAKNNIMINLQRQIYGYLKLEGHREEIPLLRLGITSVRESLLEQYNPLEDTDALKQAANIQETFLTLRKNHPPRYDLDYPL